MPILPHAQPVHVIKHGQIGNGYDGSGINPHYSDGTSLYGSHPQNIHTFVPDVDAPVHFVKGLNGTLYPKSFIDVHGHDLSVYCTKHNINLPKDPSQMSSWDWWKIIQQHHIPLNSNALAGAVVVLDPFIW